MAITLKNSFGFDVKLSSKFGPIYCQLTVGLHMANSLLAVLTGQMSDDSCSPGG